MSRHRLLNSKPVKESGPVIYWMSRDQRVQDNWAMTIAQQEAQLRKQPLIVAFCLQQEFLGAHSTQFDFMLSGLQQVEAELQSLGITFARLSGSPATRITRLADDVGASLVITDFSPLRIGRKWRDDLAKNLIVSLWEVDAHNIVPIWQASSKQEIGARALRPKILKLLDECLISIPKVVNHPYLAKELPAEWNYPPVINKNSGAARGLAVAHDFFKHKLDSYNDNRNDPTLDGTSNLSAYLHFGQIGAQKLAKDLYNGSLTLFLEQLIVRRELADNFCYYNPKYDLFEGFPLWAQKTLNNHRSDKRDYIYNLQEWEEAATHDPLWNAAQRELLTTGKMHNYMRMYWAKKILEWSNSPEEALEIAIYLNDKYQLDGRDPNGYTGIAWAIGGVHDRPWFERPVYGQIRYMNSNGAKSKFDVESYISKFRGT